MHLASCNCPHCSGSYIRDDFSWLRSVRVGYDDGFVIASRRSEDLGVSRFPYQLKLNGWGQLRHTITNYSPPSQDLNQFQLKRGRLVFSGSAFDPNFTYYIQLDGRSSSGDNVRLLDYYLNYDFGNDQFGLDPGTLVFRTGKYKVPFTMARWLSSRNFQFTDRSVASTFFDVNRSFAVGIFGETKRLAVPINWDFAIFNGLVTGGAETGAAATWMTTLLTRDGCMLFQLASGGVRVSPISSGMSDWRCGPVARSHPRTSIAAVRPNSVGFSSWIRA